jgi:DNA-binding CsgD family transcriptional regulator
MARSQRLRDHEVRAVYRLLSDLREMRHDRPAMHRHLVDTLVSLLGATGGYCAEVHGWKPRASHAGASGEVMIEPPTIAAQGADIVARVMRGMAANSNFWDDPAIVVGVEQPGTVESVTFDRLMPDARQRAAYPLFAQVTAETRYVDHLIAWHQKEPPVDGKPAGEVFGISMHRYGRGEKLFTGRELALAQLLFEELHWLHSTGRLETPTATTDLPPRLKQVLDRLLAGRAPKQIAAELDLSVHTVREHIRRLYDRFGVDGRGTLAAKFLRRIVPVFAMAMTAI